MKFLISLAWKNLSRHRRRTLITLSAIAFGIAAFIWMDAFLRGAEKDSERNLKWYETGSAKILHREYWEEIDQLPLKYAIDEPDSILRALDLPQERSTERITFSGELFFRDGSLPVKFVGIDPATDGRVFHLEETVSEEGRYLSAEAPEVLVGDWLADDLDLQVGDWVDVRTRTRYGAVQTLELEVVGLVNCPNPVINKGVCYLPLSLAQYDLDMGDAVTEIVLSASETSDLEAELSVVNARLRETAPELLALSWEELARDFVAMAEMKTAGSRVLILLIFVIAAVGISNTMLIAVYERVREIGMMRALGMNTTSIRLTFLLEAGAIGLLGSLLGLAVGALATFWIVNWGIDYSNILGDMDIGYRVRGVFRGAWNPDTMVRALVIGTVMSLAIALIPTSRALKMKITDCLRHE